MSVLSMNKFNNNMKKSNDKDKIPTSFKYVSLGAIILLILFFLLICYWYFV